MAEQLRSRPSGPTKLVSSIEPLPTPPDSYSESESPIYLSKKLVPIIVAASFGLAACAPVRAGTTTPEVVPTVTPAGEVVPGEPTKKPTESVVETPVVDFTKPSIFDGLYLGQYKDPEGKLVAVGQIEGYDSQINTYYRKENPESPAAFSLDNNWLMEYFQATTDKGGTRGITPDGKAVVQNGNVWVIEQTGEIFIPYVPSIEGKPFGYPVITSDNKIALVDNNGQIIKGGEPQDLFQTPAEIAKKYGFTGSEQLVTGINLDESGQLTIESKGRIIDVLSFLNESSKPSELISERMDVVIASYGEIGNYPFTEAQKEKLKNAIEYTQIKDEKLNMTRSYWMISQSLLQEAGEPELAEMLGYIPLAYSEDGEQWKKPGLKDTTDIPIGGHFEEHQNGSDVIMRANFDFGIFSSDWGDTTFQGREGKTIQDFITISPDGKATLLTDKLDFSWYEDYQSEQALSHLDGSERRLITGIIYPREWAIPKGYDGLTEQQATDIMVQYIKFFVNHFKDKAFGYIVVNEFGMPDDALKKIIGDDYIEIAFQAVREADPTALTILSQHENEVKNHEVNGVDMFNVTAETVAVLKSKNLIDLVASQGHIDNSINSPHDPTIAQMEEAFGGYGVPFMLSEVDANATEYCNEPDWAIIQARKVGRLLEAAVNSDVKYINFWGAFPDDNSWYELGQDLPSANSTPWGEGWAEKPMYFEALRVLLRGSLEHQ